MNSLDIVFKEDILAGKAALADYMKMVLYQADETVFERLNFEDDAPFLEPLLIAYFSTGNATGMTLEQILCAYFVERKGAFSVVSNDKGVVYVPRVGYFYTDSPNRPWQLCCQNGNYFLENSNCRFLPCLVSSDTQLEIYRHELSLLSSFYEEQGGERITHNPTIEVTQTVHRHHQNINEALEILKRYLPNLYQEITATNRSISVFYNPLVNCFANIGVTGCAFLSAVPNNETIFFLEELIHQCAHNTFNIMLFNRADYFKIDADNTQLSDLVSIKGEERSLYSAFHGLYTVAKRYEAFFALYQLDIFSGIQKHEFMGRLADLKKRFRTGLELVNIEDVYTEKGKWVYQTLDEQCATIIDSLNDLDQFFDLSNQPPEFSYPHFLALNAFEQFMAKLVVQKT